MNSTTRRVRRLAASVTFAAVAGGLALPLLAASPAQAVQETETRRVQGSDRYGTAAAVAVDTFPDGATSVIVATGEAFADALAANGLAGALDAPVLLTLRASVPEVTAKALADLGADTVYLMGGTAAVSQAVEDQLADDYTVERVQGDDRFGTAAAAGAQIAQTDDGNPLTTDDGLGETEGGLTAVLTLGTAFPDAVSGGVMAFAGRLPVLLTNRSSVPDETLTALEDLGIDHVLLIGGNAVISDDVKSTLEGEDYTTERLAGNDRWATNAEVNEYAQADEILAFGGPTAYLSTGSKFADALTGGPAAGANAAPLVLTASTSLPAPTRGYLAANANAIDEIVALGGTAAIADDVVTAAAEAAQITNSEALTVAPNDAEIRQISSSSVNNDGARTFAASGLEAGAEYVIAILDAEVVEQANPDRFSSYSLSDEASTSIESVNGSQVGSAGGPTTQEETATARADGTITFVVDATAFDEIVPVVYEDADGNGELTIEEGLSTEPFGTGGRTTWVPAEAASNTSGGSYQDIAVEVARPDDGFFIANVPVDQLRNADRTFFFDSSDRYRLLGDATTPSVFRSHLSVGDELDVEYQQELQSRFDIVRDVGSKTVGLELGTTVATNAGLAELNGGDSWVLHFSDPVTVSASASITVEGPDSRNRFHELTLTNGTNTSSWSVSGSTVTITVGRGVDAAEVFYGKSTKVTELSGVSRTTDGAAVPLSALSDKILEDDGPELMPGTSTCDAGDRTCTIEFNEPVDSQSAQDPRRYDTEPERTLLTAVLGSDGRTVTLSFRDALVAGDTIAPIGSAGPVADDDGQDSTQGFVVFVR
jgi:putative cell wall-binding protein